MHVLERKPDDNMSTVYLGDMVPNGPKPAYGCMAELVVCPSCDTYFCALWSADVLYTECPVCGARLRPVEAMVANIKQEHAERLALRALLYLVQRHGPLRIPLNELPTVTGALRVVPDIADNKVIISSE